MIAVTIPGWGELSIEYLVVDFNGTVALDGKLKKGMKEAIEKLSQYVRVFIISADSYETLDEQPEAPAFTVIKVNQEESGADKARVVKELGPEKMAAIGNGANDAAMLREAALGIAVIGEEGCSGALLREADIVVTDIMRAFELLLKPERVVATLRE
jgi:P-type E1-E2 ATPase